VAFCPKCGKEVAADTMFCPSCGFNLKSQPAPVTVMPLAQPAPHRESHTARNVIIVVVVVLLLVFVGIPFAFGLFGSSSGGLLPSQHTVNIVNGLITVGGHSYDDYEFTVPSGASSVRVSGPFTASGGGGNDINVYVMDQTDFTNWSNGHQASTYYNSGQVTTGTVSASLPGGGTYYLVYDNSFSLLSSKNVQTTVNLTYTN